MDERALKELQQIKIQDQIGDLNKELLRLNRRRGDSLRFLIGMIGIGIASNLFMNFPMFMTWFYDKKIHWEYFNPTTTWFALMGLILLFVIGSFLLFLRESKQVAEIDDEISERQQIIRNLEIS